MVFKIALKPLTFCQKFKLGHDTGVHSFPTVYRKPEVQPSIGRSSGRTTRAVKLQKNAISSRPESKIYQRARFLFKTGI